MSELGIEKGVRTKNKTKINMNTFAGLVVLILTISVVSLVFTQKKVDEPKKPKSSIVKSQDNLVAKQEIRKSFSGNLILDAIEVKEPKWVVKSGSFPAKSGNIQMTNILIENEKLSVGMTISEFDTPEEAAESFGGFRSHGYSLAIKVGDFGEKVYLDSGKLALLSFRIGNCKISIGGTNDEKLAEKFAKLVAEALGGKTSQ